MPCCADFVRIFQAVRGHSLPDTCEDSAYFFNSLERRLAIRYTYGTHPWNLETISDFSGGFA
jgi:hypothetical protein